MLGRRSLIGFCLALLAVLPGCAPQQVSGVSGDRVRGEPREVTLKRLLRQQARVWNVSYPLLTAGADLCDGRVRQQYGFWAWTRWDIKPRYRTASMGAYGLDDRLRVVHIVPGSPAAKAGLLAGDVITAVGWHKMDTGKKANAGLQSALNSETRPGTPLELHVDRGETALVVRMSPEPRCDFSLILTESSQINIFANGQDVFVTEGTLRFAPRDPDLAVLIGHVLAHRTLRHEAGTGSMTEEASAWLRGLQETVRDPALKAAYAEAGITKDSEPFDLESEIEADSLSLYFVTRGGYRLDGAGPLWEHIADQSSRAVLMKNFHPTSPERLSAIEGVVGEIDRKEQAGLPLAP
jgi:hypothetical protein